MKLDFSELKRLSLKEKLAVLLSPLHLQYYPPNSIGFIGKHFTEDGKCWLLFGNKEIHHWPHYVTYQEQPDGQITVAIKRTDLDKRFHKPNKIGAYEVFIISAWEEITQENIDLQSKHFNQHAIGICNWFCEYPFPDKPIPTLKFKL